MSRTGSFAAVALVSAALAAGAAAYPLDGYETTGIRRLEGLRLANEGVVKDVKQPPGATLPLKDVDLRLLGQSFDLPPPDPQFTREVASVLAGEMNAYGVAVLDLTDPAHPRYAGLSPQELPCTESLQDTVARFLPYWQATTVPALQRGARVLIVAHGNSLRALVKYLDSLGIFIFCV